MDSVRSTFAQYDRNGDGAISIDEFKNLCYEMGYHLKPEELMMDLRILDLDGSGAITYDEFIAWWKREDRFKMLQIDARTMTRLKVYVDTFKKYDRDASGGIDIREFKNLYMDLIKRKIIVKKSLVAAMQELDGNRDGCISFNEYVVWSLNHCDLETQSAKNPPRQIDAEQSSQRRLSATPSRPTSANSSAGSVGVFRSPSQKITETTAAPKSTSLSRTGSRSSVMKQGSQSLSRTDSKSRISQSEVPAQKHASLSRSNSKRGFDKRGEDHSPSALRKEEPLSDMAASRKQSNGLSVAMSNATLQQSSPRQSATAISSSKQQANRPSHVSRSASRSELPIK
ncbi:hypothetical protein CcCBS67573_g03834 [Chytriomyces confervae]|uniref:EF-hand domain-containing protein n=1 Tax=Chytriomyces confervae TaxID=246404 RepID=A0A507FFJ3_9FUNG|nr:hypothetical protein CcCBS67573_g03834 [Chytriomyces confervae]